MDMCAFDLNAIPMDEEEVIQEGLSLENGSSFHQAILPFKKRTLKDLYKDVPPRFDIPKDTSFPLKKRCYIRENHLDTPAQKHHKVEDTVCFDQKTLLIKYSWAGALVPARKHPIIRCRFSNKLKEQPAIKAPIETRALDVFYQDDVTVKLIGQKESMTKKRRRNTGSRSFESKAPSVIDATKLLPECIKNDPEFKDMTDVKLIIQKPLSACDIDKHQDRLAIPSGQIITDFITNAERNWLDLAHPPRSITSKPSKTRKSTRKPSKTSTKKVKSRKRELGVKLIGPCSSSNDLQVHKLSLSRWNYKSDGFRYVLKSSWSAFKNKYKLQLGDFIQVVSFRCKNRLCLAIIKPDVLSKNSTIDPHPTPLPDWGLKRQRTQRLAV